MTPIASIETLCFFIQLADAYMSNSRIIGGEIAKKGQFPHQISLQIDNEHRCGGSIITNRWILTAAHCVTEYGLDQLEILAGTTQLNTGGQRFKVEEGRIHADFDPNVIKNDIALLKTDRNIEYNQDIQPINLNTQTVNPGTMLVLSGWGYTSFPNISKPNDLQYIVLYTISLEYCKEMAKPEVVFDTQLCTLEDVGKGACRGDSGGPLIHKQTLIGIVSWGKPCALGRPDIFTNVAQYLDWINDTMK